MDWREELIAEHEATVRQLKKSNEDMRSGRFEMRSLEEGGSWRVINDELIDRNERTIELLDRIVKAAKDRLASTPI